MRLRFHPLLAVAVLLGLPASGFALSGGQGSVKFDRTPSGFDSTALTSPSGRTVRVAGPVRCTKGGRARIDVTITQRASGALARGTWTGRCRGTTQRWAIRSARAATGSFVTGQATACAAAAAANATRATDAMQWCKRIRVTR